MTGEITPYARRRDWYVIPPEWAPEVSMAPGIQLFPGRQIGVHRTHLALLAANHVSAQAQLYIPPVNMAARAQLDAQTKPLGFTLREYQHEACEFIAPRRGVLLADMMRLGKAQPLNARVLTPSGWQTIGNLQPGDLVVDPDGGVAPITGVFPQGVKPVYRVEVCDGASTECCDDHLWLVFSPDARHWNAAGHVLPLKAFRNHVERGDFLCYIPVGIHKTLKNIEAVHYVGHKESVCIAAASKRALYITDDYIVTHNTATCVMAHDPARGPLLVVGPLAAREIWTRWMRWRWPDIEPIVLRGRTYNPDQLREAPCIFAHYDILSAWQNFALRKPGTLVFDEAHMLSNRRAKRTTAALMLAARAETVIAATGTPLWNRPGGLWSILSALSPGAWGTWYKFAQRYCLEEQTPILCPNGTYRPIGSISEGDTVMGWETPTTPGTKRSTRPVRVLRVMRREARCYEVTMESGRSVICTPNHKWLYRKHGYTKLFSEIHHGTPRRPRKWLVEVAAPPPVPIKSIHGYKLGYLWGLLDGDGHHSKRQRSDRPIGQMGHRSVITGKDFEHIQTADAYAKELGLPFRFRQRNDDGRYVLASRRKDVFDLFDKHIRTTNCFRRGWLAGIYDAEGSGCYISQFSTVNKRTYGRIASWLRRFGFDIREDLEGVYIRGGAHEMLRFFGLVQPKLQRRIDAYWTAHKGRLHTCQDAIVSIEPYGKAVVISLQTETGNYVANGYGSKNCNPQVTPYGTKYEGASFEDEFKARMAEVMIRRTWQDVRSDLPPIERTVEVADVTEKQLFRVEVLAEKVRDLSKKAIHAGNLARFRRLLGQLKAGLAVDVAMRVLDGNEPVVVWAWHRDVAKKIAAAIEKKGYPSFCATGDDTVDAREKIIAEWRKHSIAALVCTISVGQVAIDLSHARQAVFAEVDYTPTTVAQAEMRTFSPSKPMAVTYLIIDHDIDRSLVGALQAKCATAEILGVPAADTAIDVIASAFDLGGDQADMQRLMDAFLIGYGDGE